MGSTSQLFISLAGCDGDRRTQPAISSCLVPFSLCSTQANLEPLVMNKKQMQLQPAGELKVH